MLDKFDELKGAQEETAAVAKLLQDRSYDVTTLIGGNATPDQICRQLFTEAWDIIHISAHGVSNQSVTGPGGTRRNRTGVVLGGGVVLDPSALAKLPVSPGIVFVNCCYLGSLDLSARPEFAANIAVELVKLGARCVIAAGWAVDDKIAAIFGLAFYEAMLNGETFGDATWTARKAAFDASTDAAVDPNKKSNTWGAYQCYGDPDYRLPATTADRKSEQQNFIAVTEAVEAAQQVRDDANIGVARNSRLKDRLETIEKLAKDWPDSAELRVALGEAWGELGELDKAIRYYAAAVAGEDASFKVRAIEQLANFRARNAVAALRRSPPHARDPVRAVKDIVTQFAFLQSVNDTLGPTSERLSLQGGCWKRVAQAHAQAQACAQTPADVQSSGAEVEAALVKMAELYRLAGEKKPGDNYPRLMACNARICDVVRKGTRGDDALKQELASLANAELQDDPDFWQLIYIADVQMNEAILLADNPTGAMEALMDAYLRAYRHIGSPVKLNSVFEQLDFYEDIFAFGNDVSKQRRESIVALARNLREALQAAVSTEQTSAS